MNGSDWPSPAANLSIVEEQIKKIVAATGVDVPSLVAGASLSSKSKNSLRPPQLLAQLLAMLKWSAQLSFFFSSCDGEPSSFDSFDSSYFPIRN